VRLRIINGSASSAFWIDLGALSGQVIAVDGNPVRATGGQRFPITMGQRLDILVSLSTDGAFPVFATREGGTMRTGLILATPGAAVQKVALAADKDEVPLDLSFERKLVPIEPLPDRKADLTLRIALTGDMATYVWTIDNIPWPNHPPLMVSKGQRVVLEMTNQTMMAHPMHLHGHHFQVIALDDKPINGAMRDTALVLPKGKVTVAFDADNPGRWPLHCHNLYHMETGMLTEIVYDGFV
jgi:FtsP/CotA-like multicopper oxidase with cupredoxin domain